MSLIASLTAAAEGAHTTVSPFLVAGIAFGVFLLLGIVTWSYRDVANRTTRGRDAAGHDAAGHDSTAGH